ncbi:MAG: hypothetical protein E7585_04630 [Ruminococcaceae bacterium]|nr:hypothetical protein [Oscillospiraceae bacterium]
MEMQSENVAVSKPSLGDTLKEVGRIVAGHTVIYRLREAAPQFFVELLLDEERCVLETGESFAHAAYVFELLVRGLVTPCSARFILEDLNA